MTVRLRGLRWLRKRHPDLVDRARDRIVDSERRLEPREGRTVDSFLWEHTRQVAAAAHRLCLREGTDPLIPVLCAVFHDMGKFEGGIYHKGDTPEEETAAAEAANMMRAEGLSPELVRKTETALRSLYSTSARSHAAADIVHDADFLVKSGRLGVAAFFSKSACRGRHMLNALTESLSRELTYAAALPGNMRTEGARALAERRALRTRAYYRGLLQEMRELGIARFEISRIAFPCPKRPDRNLSLYLASPSDCPLCGGEPRMKPLTVETGLKCDRLRAVFACGSCGWENRIGFCLPEISS